MSSSRDHVLHKARTALGRSAGQVAPAPPPVYLGIADMTEEARIASLFCALGKLAGKTYEAPSVEAAREYVASVLAGRNAVASNAPLLREWRITGLPGVQTDFTTEQELRSACAVAGVGITSADYALADTGSLVLFASAEEARLISLLPPVHIALVPRARILTGLDELLSLVPRPAERSSSMLLITGPSRTADIEQILVRGVHGPGEIHVVVV